MKMIKRGVEVWRLVDKNPYIPKYLKQGGQRMSNLIVQEVIEHPELGSGGTVKALVFSDDGLELIAFFINKSTAEYWAKIVDRHERGKESQEV